MIIVLSPSKSMETAAGSNEACSQPEFIAESEKLIRTLQTFGTSDLMQFMDISEKLATLNRARFQNWELPFTHDNATPALFSFTGDVYDGIEAGTLGKPDLRFAQQHVRILSGLYGLIRPLDLVQPYRLEMGRPLQLRDTKNLYEFWRDTITDALNQMPGDILVNLASQEYFKAIDHRKLNKHIVTPAFKDERKGHLRIISFYAKKARGMMARYMIRNRITDAGLLQSFTGNGYLYSNDLSSPDKPVFTRPEQKT